MASIQDRMYPLAAVAAAVVALATVAVAVPSVSVVSHQVLFVSYKFFRPANDNTPTAN